MQLALRSFVRRAYDAVPLKQPVFEFLRHRVRVPEVVYRHLSFQGVFTTNVREHSFRMHHHGYLVENEVFWSGITGNFEGVSMDLWIRLCQRANTIFDIGANTGLFSLTAKAVNPTAAVHAFEPLDRVFEKLRQNCALNGYSVNCVPFAASNRDGKAVVFDLPTDHIYAVTVNQNMNPSDVDVIERTIDTITLDSYMTKNSISGVDLMKIDVESHEPEVLEGMAARLKTRPTMLVEVIREEAGRRIEKIVDGLGYVFYDIDEKAGPRRVAHIGRSSDSNYLLCSAHTASFLGI